MDEAVLLAAAREAMERAYCPYSRFPVGAALLCGDGSVIVGCNVENASYGLSMCAERVALFRAVAEGKRCFRMLAVMADTEEPVSPCGACRQVMAEWLDGSTPVVLANKAGQWRRTTVSELLPRPFLPQHAKKGGRP